MLTLMNTLALMTVPIFMMVYGESSRSITFIESNEFNVFIAQGKRVKDTSIDHILTRNMNSCACKAACMAVDCAAWSVTELGNGIVQCRLDKESPFYSPPEDDNEYDSTYFYRQDKIPGTYFTMVDNLLYVKFNERMSYDDGKMRCSYLPGHRLIIIKTYAQLNDLRSRENHYYAVDLRKTAQDHAVWDDGTNFTDTELNEDLIRNDNDAARIYVTYNGFFHDALSYANNKLIVCQANPFEVEW